MNRTSRIALAALATGVCFAQTASTPAPAPEPRRFFKLEFAVKELDGSKLINSRKYVMTIVTSERSGEGASSIRAGDRIPVSSRSAPAASTQYSYVEAGVNIDCHSAHFVENQLVLVVTTDLNSAAPAAGPDAGPPLIRQNKWSSSVVVPLRKATVLFSSDDPATNHLMELELTATPIT